MTILEQLDRMIVELDNLITTHTNTYVHGSYAAAVSVRFRAARLVEKLHWDMEHVEDMPPRGGSRADGPMFGTAD